MLRLMIIKRQYDKAVEKHGENSVRSEIKEMAVINDLAVVALFAADHFGYKEIAKIAAKAVCSSNSCSEKAKSLAEKYLRK